MGVVVCEVNIEFGSCNSCLLAAGSVEMIAIQPEFFQFMFQLMKIEA
jgi:hypothetical protein